jgi:hypothetical protein
MVHKAADSLVASFCGLRQLPALLATLCDALRCVAADQGLATAAAAVTMSLKLAGAVAGIPSGDYYWYLNAPLSKMINIAFFLCRPASRFS